MKGLFIPDITAEMFRNGCLESIEALMAEGKIYDIDYSPKNKLEKIRKTLDDLDKEVADKEVTRDYWEGFCKAFNAVEAVLNENSD